MTVSMFTAKPSRGVVFSVVHNVFPLSADTTSNPKRVLDGGLNQVLGPDSRLLSDKEITIRGRAAREWRFSKGDGQQVVIMRAYLVGHELFQTICVMPKDHVCEKHAAEFLDAFDIKQD
jgi:hypothetical protein